MRMAPVKEQDVACGLEYTYVLYERFGVGEMEQQGARNYTQILFAIEVKRYFDLMLNRDVSLLMCSALRLYPFARVPFVGYDHPIPPII